MRLLPKLVIFMTGVAAVPLALAGASAIRLSQAVTREQIGDAHQRLAENVAESIRSFDTEQIQGLATAARTFPWSKMPAEEQSAALKVLFFQQASVDLLALTNVEKKEFVTPAAVPPNMVDVPEALAHRAPRAPADVELFYKALDVEHVEAGGATASALYDFSSPRGPHQAIAVSLGDGKILAAEISFEKVRTQLESFHVGDHGEAFLVSDAGRVLAHHDPSRIGEDLSKQSFLAARNSDPLRASAAGDLTALHGDDWLAAWAPVGVGGMGVVVAQPASDALRASRRLFGQTAIWTVCALLFAVVLAVFYAREVTRPVHTAAEGARLFAGGTLSHRIPNAGHDEIGDLARTFNDMAEKLEKSISEIERQNEEIRGWNASLSEKVEERTRELRDAQAQLIQSKKLAALAELGAGLAHELNNPLAAIRGFAQLLSMSVKPEDKGYKPVKQIEEQSKRCAEIVQKLLRYSEQAKDAKKEKIDLNAAVEEAVSVVEQRLKDEKIEVDRALGFGLPPILAAPGELREVFWHLVSNARSAMAGGGHLSVATWREVAPNGGDRVNVSFKDTGRGIAPDIVDRIFEPFFTTKDEWRGTGLGLAVVHRIVTDHEGTIAVESAPGKGASFTLSFPAWTLEAAAAASATQEADTGERARVKTQLV